MTEEPANTPPRVPLPMRVAVDVAAPDQAALVRATIDRSPALLAVAGEEGVRPDIVLTDHADPVSGLWLAIHRGDDDAVLRVATGAEQTQLPAAAGSLMPGHLALAGFVVRPEDMAGEAPSWAGPADPLEPDVGDQPPAAIALTSREREVLALLLEGASNKAVARHLGIAPRTAKFHVASLIEKLGGHNRLDVVAIALRRGLLML